MSPYASELAHARLDALRTLVDALNQAETPEEKRRCAVAIFNAPDPSDLDDAIELEYKDEAHESDQPDDSDDSDLPDDIEDSEDVDVAEDSNDTDETHDSGDVERESDQRENLDLRSPFATSEVRHRPSDIPYTPP